MSNDSDEDSHSEDEDACRGARIVLPTQNEEGNDGYNSNDDIALIDILRNNPNVPLWLSTVDGSHQEAIDVTAMATTPLTLQLRTGGIRPKDTKPIDIYRCIVTNEILAMIVEETNKNAQKTISKAKQKNGGVLSARSRLQSWRDITQEDIEHYFAILLHMGICRKPTISDYWSTNPMYKQPFVPSIMSKNKFELINRFIHFCPENPRDPDGMRKVRLLQVNLERNWNLARKPGEILVIDETQLAWRGRLSFRQYNPGKTHKYGIKIYKLCDPESYVYAAEVYTGAKRNEGSRGKSTEENTHCTQIVLDLAKDYLDEGRTVVTDNFYTSWSLGKQLLEKKTHLVGTIRKKRKGNPTAVFKKKTWSW